MWSPQMHHLYLIAPGIQPGNGECEAKQRRFALPTSRWTPQEPILCGTHARRYEGFLPGFQCPVPNRGSAQRQPDLPGADAECPVQKPPRAVLASHFE